MNNLKDSLESDIEERIKFIESDSYDLGPPINKKDIIGMLIVGIISFIGLVWGAI
ncbi:hypothetical protein [Lentibacillus salinarum]|uniref:Tetrahydromethanopterin S-methyltransferase n=1 Tax=Lentibacillus salinarum TaxID=446820 RepID=A0ABW3ZZK1_9BACI